MAPSSRRKTTSASGRMFCGARSTSRAPRQARGDAVRRGRRRGRVRCVGRLNRDGQSVLTRGMRRDGPDAGDSRVLEGRQSFPSRDARLRTEDDDAKVTMSMRRARSSRRASASGSDGRACLVHDDFVDCGAAFADARSGARGWRHRRVERSGCAARACVRHGGEQAFGGVLARREVGDLGRAGAGLSRSRRRGRRACSRRKARSWPRGRAAAKAYRPRWCW